jgi:ATP-dependent RNA helicase DDX51/DBP6
MIITDSLKKPLMIFHLVHAHNVTNALVFTKSAESTTRLLRLFQFFEEARIAAAGDASTEPIVAKVYSSDLGNQERRAILEDFKDQKINILICSDLISRGMDISHVSHVVSYDVPVDIRKYVHRVGRTARAGREGDSWTLVEEQEVSHFQIHIGQAATLFLQSLERLTNPSSYS